MTMLFLIPGFASSSHDKVSFTNHWKLILCMRRWTGSCFRTLCLIYELSFVVSRFYIMTNIFFILFTLSLYFSSLNLLSAVFKHLFFFRNKWSVFNMKTILWSIWLLPLFPEKYFHNTQGSEEYLYPNCIAKFSLFLELQTNLHLIRALIFLELIFN